MSFGCELQGGVWNNIVSNFRGETAPPPPCIRVLIEHDVQKVPFEVTGKYSLYDPYSNSHISSRFVGKCREIQAMNDGIKWGEAFPGIYQIKVVPDEVSSQIVINGNIYDGSAYIYDIGGTISIVNQLPIETYVSQFLAEFPGQDLHPEVLAAVAIVTRTNSYFLTLNLRNSFWAADATKIGYKGREIVPYEISQAVYVTRYMIMSRTGVYDKQATPFAAQFDHLSPGVPAKDLAVSKISLKEANEMAQNGAHAAQILARAFPGTTIMLMHYSY